MSVMTDDRMEALLIGIDAGCLPVFERLWDEGYLPNLEELSRKGPCGPLESQIPPWTPSAWPSMYTGVNPGKHGVFGFVDYEGYDWRVVTGDDVREHAIWDILDHHDRSSVVVNVPVTHPPSEIDGAIVPGFIAPEDPRCHPEGVLDDVRDAIGEYRVYPAYARGDEDYTDDEKMAEYERLVRMRADAFSYLADRFEPDFGFVQFQKTDTVFHEFDGDPEKVARVYRATDEQIGALLTRHNPKRVFVASDHGIGPYDRQEFRVNEYLKGEGYLRATKGGKGMPSWNPIRDQLRHGEAEERWDPGLVGRLASRAAKLGITPSRVRDGLRKVGLDDVAREYAPDGVVRTASTQVDFPGSEAYMRARTELGVRINLAGREPDGVVDEDEYEDVRAELVETLGEATAPDGEPVFEAVEPREEFFWGPYTDGAVDVVTIPREFEHFLSAQLLGDTFGPTTEPWNHKLDGVFAAAGTGIKDHAGLGDAHLFDVAPTILAALGIPVSDRMDGTVLPVVEPTEAMTYPDHEDTGGEVREADVEDRLADLGYLG